MYRTTGKLAYNRGDSEQRTLVLNLEPDDSSAYYDWFLQKQFGSYLKTQPPMWGRHITVIKPDEVVNKLDDWYLFQDEEVEVYIHPDKLERHWQYWSLTVESPRLVEIRCFYGVRPDFRLHMSVGRQHDWQPRLILPEIRQDIDYYESNSLNSLEP